MAKKPADKPEEKPNIFHTMEQAVDAQSFSKQLSELQELEQHKDAPAIAGYLMLKPIGRGAYAQVWEAVQVRTRRFVAVKVFVKKSGVHWFFLQREADRMIRLDKHPHIVSLLDADLGGDIPYYVMDLAQEGSLEKYIEHKKHSEMTAADTEKAVNWIKEIAQALQYVHNKQMVHCDLKPANVLLDEEGHVRVADFGHSRVLSESGGALGTLFYMAPEQAMTPDPSQAIQPDVRWDVYALGCTAYSLLSGHVPHEEIGGQLEKALDLKDRLKIYRTSIETQAVPDLFTSTKGRVDRDLSAIVAKCMKNNPDDRYKTIADVLKDLKARQEGRPVSPLAEDRVYWLSKFVTRYRAVVITAAVAVLVALTAMVLLSERQKAQVQDSAFSYVLRGKESLDKGDEASAAAYFATANKIFPSLLARGNAVMHLPPVPSNFFPHGAPIQSIVFSPNGKSFLTAGGDSGVKLWSARDDNSTRTFKTSGKNSAAAFSPDSAKVAVGDTKGNIRIFDAQTEKAIGREMQQEGEITALAFSPDSRKLVSACADGTARVWDAETGKALEPVMKHKDSIYNAAFSPDGKYILTASKDGTAHVWDSGNGSSQSNAIPLAIKNAPNWYKPDVFFMHDSRTLAATGWDGSVKFFERNGSRTGRNIFLEGLGAKAALSADGRQIVTSVLHDNTVGLIRIFGAKSHAPTVFKFMSTGKNSSFALSDDGSRVMAGGTDHAAQVWSTTTGKPLSRTLWHGDIVTAAAFSPSGKTLVTGSKDGLARLWNFSVDADEWNELDWKKSGRKEYQKSEKNDLFSHDGKILLTYGSKSACLWDAATEKAVGMPLSATGNIWGAVFSPDDKQLLLYGKDGSELWDLASGKGMVLAQEGVVTSADFSEDGKKVVTNGKEKAFYLWDASDGKAMGKPVPNDIRPSRVKVSPDAQRLMALSEGGALRLYSFNGGTVLLKVDKGIKRASFSADSQKVLVATSTDAVLYEASSGKLIRAFKHGAGLDHFLSTPDNKTVITFGTNGTGRLWNELTGDDAGNSLKHDGGLSQLTLSLDGNALLVAYKDKGWEIWDTQSGESIGDEVPIGAQAKALVFDKDSRGFKMVDTKGRVLHVHTNWVDSKMDPDQLVKTSEVAGMCKVSSQGSVEPISTDQWVSLWSQFKKNVTP